MNYMQVEYFMKVAEKGNITAAANEMFVTQPAVSRQIIQLEKELGIYLFFRNSQGVLLTPEGEQLYRFFTEQKEAFARLLDGMRRTAIGCDVSVWIQDGVDYSIVDEIVSALHPEQTDQVGRITVGMSSFDEMNQKLREPDQIALLAEDLIEDKTELTILPAVKIQHAFVYSGRLFPDGWEPQSAWDFRNKPLLVFGADISTANYRQTVMNICKSCGLRPELREVESREQLTREILVGHGYTVGSVISCEARSGQIFHTLPLKISSGLCVAYHKNSAALVGDLAVVLKQLLAAIAERT